MTSEVLFEQEWPIESACDALALLFLARRLGSRFPPAVIERMVMLFVRKDLCR